MHEIRFHPEARVELIEAIVFHEQQRPGSGEKLEEEISNMLDRIRRYPESGVHLRGYAAELEVRAFHLRHFPYSLIMASVNGEPMVFAVAHQHRRPEYWAERLE